MNALPANRVSDLDSLIASGQRVFEIEMHALQALQSRIGPDFAEASRELLACRGRIACTGMGKSGHIAKKTMTSPA